MIYVFISVAVVILFIYLVFILKLKCPSIKIEKAIVGSHLHTLDAYDFFDMQRMASYAFRFKSGNAYFIEAGIEFLVYNIFKNDITHFTTVKNIESFKDNGFIVNKWRHISKIKKEFKF